jgi:L-ornithine N5-oxygenase
MTSPDVRGAIYLQGNTEHTHGLTSTLLSNIAIRSAELVASLAAGKAADESAGHHVRPTHIRGEESFVHQSV